MQYSYDQVKKIKEDLELLVYKLRNHSKYSMLMNQADITQLEAQLPQYDAALNKIGIGGFCTDSEINGGFQVTEDFIKQINANIK